MRLMFDFLLRLSYCRFLAALDVKYRRLPVDRFLVDDLRLDADQQSDRFAMCPAPYVKDLD